jgi:hypothetical protein
VEPDTECLVGRLLYSQLGAHCELQDYLRPTLTIGLCMPGCSYCELHKCHQWSENCSRGSWRCIVLLGGVSATGVLSLACLMDHVFICWSRYLHLVMVQLQEIIFAPFRSSDGSWIYFLVKLQDALCLQGCSWHCSVTLTSQPTYCKFFFGSVKVLVEACDCVTLGENNKQY